MLCKLQWELHGRNFCIDCTHEPKLASKLHHHVNSAPTSACWHQHVIYYVVLVFCMAAAPNATRE